MINRLHELISVNRAIVESLDYDESLRLIVDKTAAFTGADACVLLLTNSDNVARSVASLGVDESRAREFAALFDERLGDALRSLLDRRAGDRLLAVPVVVHQRFHGALVVHWRTPATTPAEEEVFVQALADQAAIALDHASRFREVRQLSEQRSRLLEAIESNTTTYLTYLDGDLRFLAANMAFCSAVGLSATEVVGRAYTDILADADATRALLQRVLRTGASAELQEAPIVVSRDEPSPSTLYWDWSARPVLGELGRVQGAVVSAVDVTQKVITRRELELANSRKDEFLAMLAHELRNPLAAIATALEVLRRRSSEQPGELRPIDAAARQAAHMNRLLDDLLDVSRITSGRIGLRSEVVDLRAVIEQAISLCDPQTRARGQQLSTDLGAKPLLVEGDADRLVQVIANLANNASKYSEVGGCIDITARRSGDEIRVSVRDDGIGIAAEALPHVFELFVQAERDLDRTQGGLGVGLTIVERLVRMHEGRVAVYSEGRGQGSEFVVWLPASRAARSIPAVVEKVPAAEAEATGLRILVAEDNTDVAQMLAEVLELDGHRITIAHEGVAAHDAALRERPDVVLLDIGLPRMSGYEVADRVRREMAQSSPLIVALSGYGRSEDRRQSQDAGIDHHLVKPVDLTELRRILDTVRQGTARPRGGGTPIR